MNLTNGLEQCEAFETSHLLGSAISSIHMLAIWGDGGRGTFSSCIELANFVVARVPVREALGRSPPRNGPAASRSPSSFVDSSVWVGPLWISAERWVRAIVLPIKEVEILSTLTQAITVRGYPFTRRRWWRWCARRVCCGGRGRFSCGCRRRAAICKVAAAGSFEHVTCRGARPSVSQCLPRVQVLVERGGCAKHTPHSAVQESARLPRVERLVERTRAGEHGLHAPDLVRLPRVDVLVEFSRDSKHV